MTLVKFHPFLHQYNPKVKIIAEGDRESLYQEFLDFDFLPYVSEIHPDCYIVAGVDHKDEIVDPCKIARKFLDIKFRERK